MRFIRKGLSPDFYNEYKKRYDFKSSDNWNKLKNPVKEQLKECLKNEQGNLCVYCECGLDASNCHIEHLKPKGTPPYEELKFEYANLSVSCNGSHSVLHCGKYKDRGVVIFDEPKYLNPTVVEDIESYFSFEVDSGGISSRKRDDECAQYMIDLLKLNTHPLKEKRKAALQGFLDFILKEDEKVQDIILKEELANIQPFISFLRYCFAVNSDEVNP